jgi:uncharacterized protein (TIGR03000 family)
MSIIRFSGCHPVPAAGWSIGVLALLLVAGPALASGPPYGMPSGTMPWEWGKYYAKRAYKEPRPSSRPSQPAAVAQAPTKYRVQVTRIPHKHDADDPNLVVMAAHVPEDAFIWFDGARTRQTGTTRWFESPPLTPGKQFYYNVRVVWYEEGEWVSQTVRLPVKAGDVQCIDVVSVKPAEEAAEVAANLKRLSPEDRKLAEEQKYCAVQNDKKLGSMGVPVKILVKGEPVFLCCVVCVAKAQSDPDQTLETVKTLREKSATPPPDKP